jgi:hypothetical protein
LTLLLVRTKLAAQLKVPALYGIGAIAAYWSLERLALIIGWPA